ncbi:MAG TPA: PAS domain S-box protein [Blastocatellia bacterium]|nr:PAS domain S-box protein [Blastocatellia bacterium]
MKERQFSAVQRAEQRRDRARESELIDQREVASSEENPFHNPSEEQLRLLRTAIDQSNESVIIMTARPDPPGPEIIYVNSAFTKMTGYAPKDVIGITPHILQGPKTDISALRRLCEDCAAGEVFHGEVVNYRKDRSEINLEWTAGPVRNERGEVTHFAAAQRDVTERRRIEDELRGLEEEFRLLFDMSAIGMAQVAPGGEYLRVNHKYCQMLGYSEQELLHLTIYDVTHPDDRETSAAYVNSSLLDGSEEYSIEKRYVRKDGATIWALVNWTIVRDDEGRPLRSVANIQDITARKRAEAEREELLLRERAAREAAEAANRSKDEFLAVVSHELRSPLNAILGYVALLRYGEPDAQKVRQAMDVIERNGKAQGRLIDDLLDTARIISGKLRLSVGPVDMTSMICEAVQTAHPAAEAKGVSLQADLPPGIGQITGDHTRLQQIIWNLLSNAVKFTPQGGRVEVRLERMDPYICVIVSDTGKGIGPDFLPYVFDRFRQFDASSARRYGGLGLGLALVKYLVELHGGTIEATSPGEGQGTTFKVTLPVRAIATPIGDDGGAPDTIKDTVKGPRELAGVRALVVDDENDARELLKSALGHYGADVVAVSSAAEAYALITAPPADGRPDIVVADIGMPDEDGYSLIRRVREWEEGRGSYIPAVALTAYGRVEDRMRALKVGFQMHVAKPVDPDELVIVIKSLVDRRNNGERSAHLA